ncbi:MAG: hypothetical protein ACE5JI_06120, partial [Acidobacteriota bacterium]
MTRSVLRLLAAPICFGLLAPAPSLAQWDPHADLIFTNGKIVTVDQDFSLGEGLAIKDGRVIAVGTDEEVLAHRGKRTRVVDLEGRTVIPGLQDSHIHFLELGHDVSYQADLTFA